MKERSYRDQMHFIGRIWILSALLLLLMVPLAICIRYDVWPTFASVLKGLVGVAPVFWTVTLIEFFTYVPMLGTGGSYLGFVTGNVSNLKVPCALNAMESAEVEPGSEEGEVVSTIAIAISSMVTVLIISVGVLLLSRLQPLLQNPVLQPAFDNILPALFGGLAVVYVSKNWKIAIAPLVFMVALFVLLPMLGIMDSKTLSGYVGILVPVGAGIAIGWARLLYKKGKL